jgi:PAS domain-containing protein
VLVCAGTRFKPAQLMDLTAPLNILVVEDQVLDAELVVAAIERSGIGFAPIKLVATRAQFLEELNRPLDLILCDYRLPGFGALEALHLVIGEETAVEAIKAGANDYLLKDRLGRLGTAINHAVAQSQLRAAAELAEENLRQSEYKYRCLFDQLLDAVLLCDSASGRIIDLNQRSAVLLGRDRATILGTRLAEIIPTEVWTRLHAFAVANSESVVHFHTSLKIGDDRTTPVQIRATVVIIHHRTLLYLFIDASTESESHST